MRRASRLAVLLLFLAAGGIYYWQFMRGPVETPVTFVLTGVEVRASTGQLLRHDSVELLTCRVLDDEGETVATLTARSPGPIARPPSITLPQGTYTFHVVLRLRDGDGDGDRRASFLRQVELTGDPLTVHL